jgi:hypothetical protein
LAAIDLQSPESGFFSRRGGQKWPLCLKAEPRYVGREVAYGPISASRAAREWGGGSLFTSRTCLSNVRAD